ncbi:MAG: RNA polymerase sigma factor [Thermoleophilia bacterium]
MTPNRGVKRRPRSLLSASETAQYETIVRRYSERLVQMLGVIFLDRELAADAAQEAFVQLYLHFQEVGESPNPEAWIYRVAVNRGKDYKRQLIRKARLLARLTSAPQASCGGTALMDDDFMRILKQLPLKQRTAAALFYQADLSISQIARIMDISEGAVNSHLNRARQTLKTLLEVRR